jgi:DNA-binding NarL/FixJ family response regulator
LKQKNTHPESRFIKRRIYIIKVIIVEDNDTIREGLAVLINGTEGFRCLASYSDCESMLKHIEDLTPDILLMDIVLPGMSGIDGVKQIKQIVPDLSISMLTVYGENDLVFEALCAGACGYLLKNTPPARLLEAIKEAHEGGSPMSPSIARKVVSLLHQKICSRLLPKRF